jgi:hypothetical protein
MQTQLSQSVTIAAISGLTETEQQLVVEAINRAKGLRFTINRAMLPTVRFGTICWALRADYQKNRRAENLPILGKVVKRGLLHAIGRQ